MRPKDLLLISHLRANARTPMTKISKRTKIPVSTIFDKLKEYDQGLIKKHTCLLDFRTLGYDVKAHLLFKLPKEQREPFLSFLKAHQAINNVFRVNNGYDYLIEAVFKNLSELNEFYEATDAYRVEDRQEYFVLEDLAREQFMNYQPGFEILQKTTLTTR
ncbi:Lrp/AsnC family transcriptional regulator [Candidatus Woesearchaeota archaeon]|nr:Lrp/AsnC family transcriptional regulator [Candidatus Woesearchaeota archaeon]